MPVWLGATEGLVAAGGMRLWPLGGQTLGFGYLFASDPHIRAGLVSGGHATIPVTLAGVTHIPTLRTRAYQRRSRVIRLARDVLAAHLHPSIDLTSVNRSARRNRHAKRATLLTAIWRHSNDQYMMIKVSCF